MTLARLLRSLTRFRRLQPQFGRVHALVLRASRGRLKRSRILAGGQPVLALTTSGRRSGVARTTTVAYLHHGHGFAVSAMNLGSDHDPAWCLNLRANPSASILVDGTRRAVRAREADDREAAMVWRELIARLPATGQFRTLAQRHVPIFVLDPVG